MPTFSSGFKNLIKLSAFSEEKYASTEKIPFFSKIK
jgi:hypothetical protein